MMSADLVAEINALVERGKTPHAPAPAFNTANLAAPALGRALTPSDDLVLVATTTTVSPGTARTTSSFRRDGTTIVVTIDVFDDLHQPMRILITDLAGFQAHRLASVITTGPPHLGAYSFRTRNSAFWLRGNLSVRIDQFSDQAIEPPFDLSLATSLDTHLSSGLSEPHLPSIELDPRTIPQMVRSGDTIRIALNTNLESFAAATSVSENADVVVPRGPPNEHGHFEFYPRAPGTAKVLIVAAAQGSLRPIVNSFEVTVENVAAHHPPLPIATVTGAPPADLPAPPAWPGE
jgi:hypothetical protein